MQTRLDVIVPVQNEAVNIPSLVERIHATLTSARISYHIIFVDDHSTDETVAIIQNLKSKYPITLHSKEGEVGKAYSILEGADLAKSDLLAMIDADLQYPPEMLPKMVEAAKIHGVVVANRKVYKSTFIRRLASRMIAFTFGRLLFGLRFDVQSGMKVFRRDILKHVRPIQLSAWAFDIPLLFTARELGYSIGSVDIVFERRAGGESKINHIHNAFEIGHNALKLWMRKPSVYVLVPSNDAGTYGEQGQATLLASDVAGMRHAGVIHKRRKFITHTTLAPNISALQPLSSLQKLVIFVIGISIIAGLLINTLSTAIAITAILSTIYFIDVLFNLFLIAKSLSSPPEITIAQDRIRSLDVGQLPVYSILCPLYREAHVLEHFLHSVDKLDWPKNKLDVQLLLEEDDTVTIDAARRMKLPPYVRITVVPDSQPKTKPKACNFGLSHVKGEYVVIYDAEDMPDPQQLKKSYLAFSQLPATVVCLQAKLNYYNPHQNWLTRFFTAEYSLWFDVILNGLQSISTAIPLGGTSNHFRTKDLIRLKAWDPFNVTEDCDLGVRLFKNGYKTAIINSTTLEEANSNLPNWFRQRSRWIKGYIQTYFVHMRDPIGFTREMGVHALFFQLTIGGKIAFMLINPFLWVATISYFALYRYVGSAIESIYPTWVFYMAAISLVFGNFLFLYYYMIGTAMRKHWGVVKYVLFIPFYWLLVSIGAGIAVIQFAIKPHYWEKTNHGYHLRKKRRALGARSSWLPNISIDLPIPRLAGGGILVAAAMIGNFSNFLYNAFLGRAVSIEDFGLITLFTSFFYASQVIVGAVGSTVTYRSAYLLGKFNITATPFWRYVRSRSFVPAMFFALLWVSLIPFMSGFFHEPNYLPFLLFTPVWVLGIVGAVDAGFLNGNLRFPILAILVITEALSKFLFSILFIQSGYPQLVYASIPLSLLLTFSIGWWFIVRLPKKNSGTAVKEMTYFPRKFFTVSLLSKVSGIAILSVDVLLVKHFFTPQEAGQYALVSLVGKMIFFVGSLFSQFIFPYVSREEGAGRNSSRVFYRLIAACGIVSLSGFVGVGLFAPITIPILFGERAYSILSILPIYTLAMAYITVAGGIVAYHQIKKQYMFPVLSFCFTILQVATITLFHQSLLAVAEMMLLTATLYLVTMVVLHGIYPRFVFFLSNLADFFGLFSTDRMHSNQLVNGKLRILMYNWRDTKHVWAGGAEVYIHELSKRWVAEGNRVTVFCGNDGHHPRHQTIDGVHIVRRGGFYTVYLWAFLYYLIKFRGSYDAVVDSANGVPFFTPLYVRKPTFLLIHHVHQRVFRENLPFLRSRIAMAIEKKLMPMIYRNKNIITVSDSSKKDFIGIGLATAERIQVVRPGINRADFTTAAKTAYPSVLYLGRLKPYKNIDVAIRAFAKIASEHPTAKLIIAGEGESMNSLVSLTEHLHLSGRVIFKGKVTDKQKADLLAQSWVALQPSSFEGWGITVLEANASGTPVIASNVNGLKDSVVHRKTGLLVPVKNVDGFSNAMDVMIREQTFRRLLSRNAYNWAKEFSWEKSASQLFTILVERMQEERKMYATTGVSIAQT